MLTKCLEHEIPYVREAAADALGELGEHAAASIPAVMELLQHRDRGIRKAAAYALGQSNSRDPRHPDTIAGGSNRVSDIAEAPWSAAEWAVALLFVELLQAQLGRQVAYLLILICRASLPPDRKRSKKS